MLELVAEYIDKLDTAAEDRLLTTKLVPHEVSTENGTAGCLVGVATGAFAEDTMPATYAAGRKWWPSVMEGFKCGNALFVEFNTACERDPVKTTEFIRNRILENRFAKLPKKHSKSTTAIKCRFVFQ